MRGSNYLKVTGILMIIFGAISMILSFVLIAGISLLSLGGFSMGLYWLGAIFMLLGSIAEFVAGIIGVVNHSRPDKAKVCLACGIVVIALSVISNVCVLVADPESFKATQIFSGLLFPVLYTIGAKMNMNQTAQ